MRKQPATVCFVGEEADYESHGASRKSLTPHIVAPASFEYTFST